MVILTVALLALGLTMAGAAMIGLLQRHLTSQIDAQLVSSAPPLARQSLTELTNTNAYVPTRFFIRAVHADGQTWTYTSPETLEYSGTPNIPDLLEPGEFANTESGWTRPVTVSSSLPGSTWRAMAIPLGVRGSQDPVGVMTIALPLTDVQRTLSDTAFYFLLTSMIIVIAGGTIGQYLVRKSLKPLRNIEVVAGRIAAGDLSQRIPPEPPTTEVGSLALSLNTMLSQVEQSFHTRAESDRKIRRFVSDASHELRTPLAAIRGYGELYQMGGVPGNQVPEVISRIHSEATRMGNLVEDLLTLARIDEGRPLALTPVDLVKIADNAASDLEALDPARDITVRSLSGRKAPMTLTVNVDRDRIQQVFTNLVGNINRYTSSDTPVELALGLNDGMAIVEFRDHGPGIAEDEQKRVFERFYRTEDSRARTTGGSGLGLAIVASIIGAHNGTTELKTTPGGGLTVRIELPTHLTAEDLTNEADQGM